VTSDLKS